MLYRINGSQIHQKPISHSETNQPYQFEGGDEEREMLGSTYFELDSAIII